jgi:hypothetical protein
LLRRARERSRLLHTVPTIAVYATRPLAQQLKSVEALRAELQDLVPLKRVMSLHGLQERYYAISTERRVRHPAVTALIDNARDRLG